MLELLKVPMLMEKRVKKGDFASALQLQQFSAQLSKKHQNVAVIHSIQADVALQVTAMRDQLHRNLRGNVKLQQCLENISYLRRLEMYSDMELRVIFLKSRDAWLQVQRERISPKNAYSFLSKLVDHTRDHIYEVITQYRIIFSDSAKIGMFENNEGRSDASVLSSWVVHQIEQFLSELRSHLPRVQEGSSIRNLMDLTISISRVGVDVSGQKDVL